MVVLKTSNKISLLLIPVNKKYNLKMQKMFWRETEHKKTLNGQQILKLKRRESE